MKKTYQMPATEVAEVQMEGLILSGSGGSGSGGGSTPSGVDVQRQGYGSAQTW